MATTITPPSPSSTAGGSNYELLGAALAEPASEPSQAEASTPEPAAPTETTTTEPEPETQAEPETSETSADATATDPAAEETNPYDVDPDAEVAPQTLDAILKTPRGKEIYSSHKLLREMGKPLDQGGLGHVPTLEQAREYYGAYRDWRLIENDLHSGNPQQAERLIAHLFNPQRGEGLQAVASQLVPSLAKYNPRALEAIAPQLLPTLANINPEAYATAAVPILNNYSTQLWERWAELPDGELKNALGYAAQVVEKDLTGKYRGVDGKPTQQEPQVDPYADKARELTFKEQQIRQWEQQQAQNQARAWAGDLTTSIKTELMGELDLALAPLKALYKDNPARYERRRQEFHDGILPDIPKNSHAWQLYQVQMQEARRTGNPEALKALAKEYVKLAKPVIAAKRKQFLEEEGAAVKSVSDARHAELRQTEPSRAATGGGSPVTPKTGGLLPKQSTESNADYNRRLVAQALR